MFLEPLEGRALLASDLGAIEGLVYIDDGDNVFQIGEEVSGAQINLYLDDGDNIFEPGADDALVGNTVTDANGEYVFEGLSAGTYWVEQPAQTVGSNDLVQVFDDVTISPTQAQGIEGLLIDSFISSVPTVIAVDPVGTTDADTADLPTSEVLGGERDFEVEITSSTDAGQSVTLTVAAGKLSLNPSIGAQGRYTIVWDGDDNDGSTIDYAGLGNVDLTDGGNSSGILLEGVLVDQAGGTATIRIYTSQVDFSELTINLPDNVPTDLFFKFADFVPDGGGAGADFTQVNAIELEFNTSVDAMDGEVDLIRAMGYSRQIVDFDNYFESDLELQKTVDNPTPNLGDDVTFTISVTNNGPDAAMNVAVQDLLPAGLTFVSDNPSQGSYDSVSGVWTVGNIASGGNATLEIVATVATIGAKTNIAEVSASDSIDIDSTPGNGIDTEDDYASVVVTPQQIDLSLTKTVDNASVDVGTDVTFTITVSNAAGVSDATGVVVLDLLPAGLTYVSDNPSQGTYDELTGVWTVGALSAGSSATLQLVATKTNGGAIVNTAEIVAADQPDADSTPNNAAPGEDDIATQTVSDPAIDLSLTKDVDSANVNVGENVTFTITVSNAAGMGNATGVVVRDLLPAGLTFVSDNPSQGTYDAGTGVWTVGAINAGASATLQIVATKSVAGALLNTAEIIGADQTDIDSTPGNAAAGEDDIDSETINDLTIDLALTKIVNNATPNVGEDITFTITVSNTGLGDATGVVVTDLLPAGLTFVSDNPSQGTYDEGTGVWTVGAINASASATLQIVATVASLGAKTNVAEVTAANETDVDSTPNNGDATEDDQASVTVTPASIDLSLEKTVNNPTPNVGENVTFTITVTNAAGSNDATGVEVTDILPAGLTFVSANPSQGAYTAGTGIWNVGTISAGASATLNIVATVTTGGVKTNMAAVTAADQTDVDSTPGNQANTPNEDDTDSVDVTPATIDLSLTKTVDVAAPNRNQQVTFTVTVSNAAGVADATGVVVTDQLPEGLTFVSSMPSQGSYNSTTGVWTVGTVNAGANATLQIVATVTTIGEKINSAEVTAADQTDIDSTPGNSNSQPGEDDTASVSVTPAVADLSLTKTVDNPSPNRGQNVTFTITLSNAAGSATATNVTVTDLLPSDMTFVSSTPSTGTYTAATGAWVVPSLAAGSSATLTIVATPTSAGAKVNTAEVTASDQFDSDSTPGNRATAPNEDDTASATVTPTATDLALSKSVNVTSPKIGDQITFTITVSNTSGVNATGVSVTDQLPAGLSFVSANPSQGTYDSNTGIWTVGAINAGSNATLTITATVTNNATKVNTAEITALDQFDTDSTPGNNAAGEDDLASVTVQPFLLSKRLSVVR
jgi:uncharacterized repeat protein (TIGR01451 family)